MTMLRVALTLSIVAMMALVGCGGSSNPSPPQPYEISAFEVGSSQSDGSGFVHLTNGQDAPLISGSQGGFHVWLKVRFAVKTQDAPPTSVFLDRQARLSSTHTLISTVQEMRDVVSSADQPGALEIERAMPMFLCPHPAGLTIEDQRLVLRVRAFADDQSKTPLAESTIELVPHCPHDGTDLAMFCDRICAH